MIDLIFFTDLDGTLLDHYSYSWQLAQTALDKLSLNKIPLIFCTSKTKAESIYFREQIGIEDPFIVENGAAIYSPSDYFNFRFSDQNIGEYEVKKYGTAYPQLRKFIKFCRNEFKIQLLGFGDLKTEKIQELTGLTEHQVKLAVKREFSEPFYFLDEKSEKKLPDIRCLAKEKNLEISKGGRFYHLSGLHDKGNAVETVINHFLKNRNQDLISIGIGEALNDFSMLQKVKIPCLVKNAKDQYEQEIVAKLFPRLAGSTGPEGWNKIVLEILAEYDIG